MTQRLTSISALRNLRRSLQKSRDGGRPCITICAGPGCLARGATEVVKAFEKGIEKYNLADKTRIRASGCHGFCERAPLVVFHPQRVCYTDVKPADVDEIISKTALEGRIIDRLLYHDPSTRERIIHEQDIPFYKLQKKIVSGKNEEIDPTRIDDYIATGGYRALEKVFSEMTPEGVIDRIKESGLRGRGGGGFPSGAKWEACRQAPGREKFVICNADEGDPGAFMDRSILEGNPHSVIEGMIIGAYAIGSQEGYVYVRNEYPIAVKNLTHAIDQAMGYGLLGRNILGSELSLTIKINRGGGAFVCGESTALMASLEGRVGEPRAKYVHTVEHGLWNQPSNLNNVETWANVPIIIDKGADWYSSIGTEHSKGTKIFSLVGKINHTGLVEVPMGMTLRQIIYDIGGGIPGGKRLKAVQTGGPSGGCIPESLLDIPVDFDRLQEVGSMMGSGGLIVMDEDTCMVDVARYFVRFLEGESCGKCTPCREGLRQMEEILGRISEGAGMDGDIELLEDLSLVMVDTSLCALGSTAPNPVLSTIRYFRDEYEVHIRDKRCPAKVCKNLIAFAIDPDKCTGCGACLKACPVDAISGDEKQIHHLDIDSCVKCGACYEACKFEAIQVE
ncbi:MAG: 4Fe-4S dicluster domain-containing protein [Proteobacteria bacterium]|nr:4Fe-4S dicluster domain-containing protein [Pseudomonadota bacterium]